MKNYSSTKLDDKEFDDVWGKLNLEIKTTSTCTKMKTAFCDLITSVWDKLTKTKMKTAFCNLITNVQSRLLIVYHFVFRHSVEEVAFPVPSPKGEHVIMRGYLFGGYRCPKKPFWMHAYFLTMLLIVAMWFSLIFCDTFLYRKTTTCNDIDVRNDAYLCFDIDKPISAGAVICNDPAVINNPNIYVICYLSNFNITVALSLSFSFMQLVILLIHISFSLTLWCVKNCSPEVAIVVHVFLCILYAIGVIIICSFLSDHSLKIKGINFFYGMRILRVFMVILGFISLSLVTAMSPYYWLIDKSSRRYYPSHYWQHADQMNDVIS